MPHQPPRQSYEFEEGTIIANRYQVVRQVGCGGMGVVVLVIDQALDNNVLALKLLYPQHVRDQTVFARFRREVLLARRLSHPNIVRLYDFGSAGKGYYFISMEYVDGVNLSKRIYAPQEERITFGECLRVLKHIAAGIGEAHRQNVVHRDLKPDNVIMGLNGDIKLTDFGLARTLTSEQNLTQTGEAVGTPYYMSPEQIRGEMVDQRSDLYSLGIIGFELVAGYRPFQHDVWLNLATMHLSEALPQISTDQNNVPLWYQDILEIATAKNRDDRYQSVAEFAAEIGKYLDDPSEVPNVVSKISTQTKTKRKRALGRKLVRWGIISAITCASLVLLMTLIPRIFGGAHDAAKQFTMVLEQKQGTKLPFLRSFFGVNPEVNPAGFKAALKAGDTEGIRRIVAQGMSPNVLFGKQPALFYLIDQNIDATVPVLLEAGADANIGLEDGTSPLIFAIKKGNVNATKSLIAANADTNWRDKGGQSALHYAAKTHQTELAKLLLEANAVVDSVNHQGQTPLGIAVSLNSLALARELLLKGANPNIQDRSKNTPLHTAIINNNIAISKLLLGHGSALGIRDKEGRDALELARTTNSERLIGLLERMVRKGRHPRPGSRHLKSEHF